MVRTVEFSEICRYIAALTGTHSVASRHADFEYSTPDYRILGSGDPSIVASRNGVDSTKSVAFLISTDRKTTTENIYRAVLHWSCHVPGNNLSYSLSGK